MTKAGTQQPFRVWCIVYTSPDGSTRVIRRVGRNTPIKWAKRQAKPGEKVSIWEGSQDAEEGGR